MSKRIDGDALLTITVGGVDVTNTVVQWSTDMGKTAPWGRCRTGTAQVVIDNSTDFYAHGPDTLSIGSVVTIKLAYGFMSRTIFTGKVAHRSESVVAPGTCTVTLACADLMEELARKLVFGRVGDVASGNGDSITQRMAKWLTAAGVDPAKWNFTGPLDLACPPTVIGSALNGDTWKPVAGGVNLLEELFKIADADGGDLFCDGDGKLIYLPWVWRKNARSTVIQTTFADRPLYDWVPFQSASHVAPTDEIANRVIAVRRAQGTADVPVQQVLEDPGSQATWGIRTFDPLTELELQTDGMVASRASSVLDVYKQPRPRWDAVSTFPAVSPSRSWARCIDLRFGDLVQVTRGFKNGQWLTSKGHVIGVRWQGSPAGTLCTFLLEGTAGWDRLRPPVPPAVVVVDPSTGCVRIPEGAECNATDGVIWKDVNGNVLRIDPPGSLCGEGVCNPPNGWVEVCFRSVSGQGDVCVQNPAGSDYGTDAILWVDGAAGNTVIERVAGLAALTGPAFHGTQVASIPGGYDSIDANASGGGGFDLITNGGLVTYGVSDKVDQASLSDGWTVEFWLRETQVPPSGQAWELLNLGNVVRIMSSNEFPSSGSHYLEAQAYTFFTDPQTGQQSNRWAKSFEIASLPLNEWHLWRIEWSKAGYLITKKDGAEV